LAQRYRDAEDELSIRLAAEAASLRSRFRHSLMLLNRAR
jgi:hypothetical protein